jgi:DNA-binding IclR family transcriptional regulator
MSRTETADSDYVREGFRDGLRVLEALLEAPGRGFTIVDLQRKTGLSYSFCRRTLLTLRDEGYARLFMKAWKPGEKCRVFAARADLAFTREATQVLNLADSMRQF